MAKKHEILTLQFGNYSNYIGTHWWNLQESGFSYDAAAEMSEIDNDVFYREGVNHVDQITYTPRLLLLDLEGAFKTISSDGELYGGVKLKRNAENNSSIEYVKKIKDDIGWKENDIEIVEQPEVLKSSFQNDLNDPQININEINYNFASTVKSWEDFLYARYHPRTTNTINKFKHSTEKETFDTFTSGVQLWQTEQFEEDFCDKIRMYIEECDYLQGFQTIFDCYNGFSGIGTQCIEYLNDEYGRAIFALPVFSSKNLLCENADEAMTDSIRVINSLFTFNQLSEQSTFFVPLSTQQRVWRQLGQPRTLPLLNYKTENLYETSAILATYLDTISLRYRLKNTNYTLGSFCSDMTNYGRKFGAAALSLPFPMEQNMDLIDCLDKFEGNLMTQLTPHSNIQKNYVIQSLCVRGIPSDRLKRPLQQAKNQMQMAAYRCNSISEMFQLYLQCNYHSSLAHVTSVTTGMPTRVPFPIEMFNENVNMSGFLSTTEKNSTEMASNSNKWKINSCPVLAAVQISNDLSDTIDVLHREAKRIKIKKIYRFKAAGMEEDDYHEALEKLLQFKDNYDSNYEL